MEKVIERVKSITYCPSTKRGLYFTFFVKFFDENVFAIEFRIDSFVFRVIEPSEKLLLCFLSRDLFSKYIFDVGATQVAGFEPGGIHERIFRHLKIDLPDIDFTELKKFNKKITKDIYNVLKVEKSVNQKKSFGSTAPKMVKGAATKWVKKLQNEKN